MVGAFLVPDVFGLALLSRFFARPRLVTLRQRFVRRCQNCAASTAVITRGARPARLRAPHLWERHHTCLASRISMASTYGSLRQRRALRSASARLPAHSARLKAVTPLGQNLLGGCAAKWITTQWL